MRQDAQAHNLGRQVVAVARQPPDAARRRQLHTARPQLRSRQRPSAAHGHSTLTLAERCGRGRARAARPQAAATVWRTPRGAAAHGQPARVQQHRPLCIQQLWAPGAGGRADLAARLTLPRPRSARLQRGERERAEGRAPGQRVQQQEPQLGRAPGQLVQQPGAPGLRAWAAGPAAGALSRGARLGSGSSSRGPSRTSAPACRSASTFCAARALFRARLRLRPSAFLSHRTYARRQAALRAVLEGARGLGRAGRHLGPLCHLRHAGGKGHALALVPLEGLQHCARAHRTRAHALRAAAPGSSVGRPGCASTGKTSLGGVAGQRGASHQPLPWLPTLSLLPSPPGPGFCPFTTCSCLAPAQQQPGVTDSQPPWARRRLI